MKLNTTSLHNLFLLLGFTALGSFNIPVNLPADVCLVFAQFFAAFRCVHYTVSVQTLLFPSDKPRSVEAEATEAYVQKFEFAMLILNSCMKKLNAFNTA